MIVSERNMKIQPPVFSSNAFESYMEEVSAIWRKLCGLPDNKKAIFLWYQLPRDDPSDIKANIKNSLENISEEITEDTYFTSNFKTSKAKHGEAEDVILYTNKGGSRKGILMYMSSLNIFLTVQH